MNPQMLFALTTVALLLGSGAEAQVKKCVLPNGKTVYQDFPCESGVQAPVLILPTAMGNEPVLGLSIAAAANSQWGKSQKTYSLETASGKTEIWEYSDGRKLTFLGGRVVQITRSSAGVAATSLQK